MAIDCVVPVVHPANPVRSLSSSHMALIYAGVITNWKMVGGNNQPIVVVGRDTGFGTYKTRQKEIMKYAEGY